MPSQSRYHIRFKGRRTTITVDAIVSELLAAKFHLSPDDPETHGHIRQWLQETLEEKLGHDVPGGNQVSQYARQFAIEAIADSELMKRVWTIRLAQNG